MKTPPKRAAGKRAPSAASKRKASEPPKKAVDPNAPKPPSRDEVFAWMRANMATHIQGADHFGLNRETVKSWVKRHGDPRGPDHPPAQQAKFVPNVALTMPADDRAELVAHVRSLRRRLVLIDERVQTELAKERPDLKGIDSLTRSASATASEMAKVLEAHPGLMMLVDGDGKTDDTATAARIADLYGPTRDSLG